jgi:splicing factor 3B subunit 1
LFLSIGIRVKPYLTQVVSTILWRLNNKSAKVRQQAADLTTRLAVVIKQCGEDQLLSRLGLVLFEQLGEEYPDTLGSIIAAEGAIANVVGMTQMNPPVKDLCEFCILDLASQLMGDSSSVPRMTPILRNRHEKVQEASINLIGRIGESFNLLSSYDSYSFRSQPIVVQNSCLRANGCVFASSFLIS